MKKLLLLTSFTLWAMLANAQYTPSLEVTDKTWPNSLVVNTGTVEEFVYKIQNNGDVNSTISKVYFKTVADLNIEYWPIGNPVWYLTNFDSTQHDGYWNPYTYKLLNGRNKYVRHLHGTNEIDSLTLDSLMGMAHAYLSASADSFIYVHIPFYVKSCNDTGGLFTFYRLCGYDTASKCNTLTEQTNVSVNLGCPNITAAVNVFDSASYCPHLHKDTAEVGFLFHNTAICGSGPAGFARADSLRLYLYCTNGVASLDTSSFKINGVHIPHSCYTRYYSMGDSVYFINLANYHVQPGNGSPFGNNTLSDMDGNGSADELAEGNSFEITSRIIYDSCPPFNQCGYTNWYLPAVAAIYNNQCNTLPKHSLLLPVDSLSPNAYYQYSSVSGSSFDSCPADVVGVPFNLKICPGNYSQRFTPVGFHFDCPHGYYQLSIPLPRGYHLDTADVSLLTHYSTPPRRDSSSGIFKYVPWILDSGRCHLLDTFYIHPLLSEHLHRDSTRDTIFVNFGKLPINDCGNVFNETNLLSCFEVPISMDCSQIPASNVYSMNVDELAFSLQYVCDSACHNCADNITCGNTTTYRHCSGSCTSIPFTTEGWTFLRTNLGYINQKLPLFYTTSCFSLDSATLISVADTLKTKSAANLQAAYPGDQVEAKVSGGYDGFMPSSFRGEYLQIRYSASIFSRSPYHLFELDPDKQSYFIITGSNIPGLNGKKLYLPKLPAAYTDVTINDTVQMSFSLDTAIYNTNHTWYSVWKADDTVNSINVAADLHLRVLNDSSESLTFPVFISCGKNNVGLRTEYMCAMPGNLVSDTLHSCDSWGAPFTLLQPCPGTGLNVSNHSTCDSFPVSFNFNAEGALHSVSDDFPGEFRPFAELDSTITITLPPGYLYDTTIFYTYIDNYDTNRSNNHFSGGCSRNYFLAKPSHNTNPTKIPTISTVLTFTGLNNSCWPLIDQKVPNYAEPQGYYLNVYTKPVCNAQSPDTFYCKASFKVGTQQSNDTFQLRTPVYTYSAVVTHVNPVVILDGPSPLSDHSNQLSFTFKLCNSSLYTVHDGWVSFENVFGDLFNMGSASLTRLSPHQVYTPTRHYKKGSDSGVIFNVGNIGIDSCQTLVFSAYIDSNSRSCPPPIGGDTGKMVVRFGNVCSGTLLNPDSTPCENMVDTFYYHVYPSTLQLTNTGYTPDTGLVLCNGTLVDNLTITSPNLATITNPIFWVKLPSGVTCDSIVARYPCDGSRDTTVKTSDTIAFQSGFPVALGWNMNKDLKIHGLRGTLGMPTPPNDSNTICVKVYMRMSCLYNFDSIKFYATGYSACSILLSDAKSILPGTDTACCYPCNAPHGFTVFSNVQASRLTAAQRHQEGQSLFIKGTFTVNKKVTINDCEVRLAPHANIEISTGDTLTILGCSHLHAACDTMWGHIRIEGGGVLNILDSNAQQPLIEDADTAIIANNVGYGAQGLYNLDSAWFNRNWIDIAIEPSYTGVYQGTASNCVFACRNLSAQHCTYTLDSSVAFPSVYLIYPHTGQISEAGLCALSCPININHYGIFDNHTVGLSSKYSRTTIMGNTFRFCGSSSTGSAAVDIVGFNMYAFTGGGCSLFVGDGTTANANHFAACYNGIWAYYQVDTVKIQGNSFSADAPANYAIAVEDAGLLLKTDTMAISYNDILGYNMGVYCNMNHVEKGSINNNNISFGDFYSNGCPPSIGIELNEVSQPKAYYSVYNNTISTQWGIMVYGVTQANINNNSILLQKLSDASYCYTTYTAGDTGISLIHSTVSAVKENTISRDPIYVSYATTTGTGIIAAGSSDYSITCNTINDANQGMTFDGMMTGPVVTNNSMNANVIPNMYGLNFLHNGEIGTQGSSTNTSDNTWSISGSGGFACSSHFDGSSPPSSSKLWVRSFHTIYSPNIYPCAPDTAYERKGTPHVSLFHPPCEITVHQVPYPPFHTNGGGGISPYTYAWQIINSILTMSDSIAHASPNSSMYSLYRDTTMLLAKYSLQTTLWDDAKWLPLTDTLTEFIDSMRYSPMGEIMAIDTAIYGAHSTTISDSENFVNLLSTLGSITPVNNVETNLQTMTAVYLQTLINKQTSLTSTQYSNVQTVANKCPYLDGPGVYMARSLWSGFVNPFTVYPDSCASSTGGGGTHGSERRAQTQIDTNNNTNISIHPNPNNGSFILSYNLDNENDGILILFDELGEKVGEYSVSGSSGEMPINNPNLREGVYIYKLYSNSSIVKIGKIIVIK